MNNSSNPQKDKFNYLLIIVIILFSIAFFKVKGIGKGEKVLELAAIGITAFMTILHIIYNNFAELEKRRFGIFIGLIMLSILFSVLSAAYFHNQSIPITIYESRPFFMLLFYLFLHYTKPDEKWLLNLLLYMGIASGIVYIMQNYLYPLRITEAKMFFDRGTLRINLPGSNFRHIAFFLCVYFFFRTNEKKYGFGALLMIAVAFISAFRTIVALYCAISLIYLLISKKVKNKFALIAVSALIGISVFFTFQNIIIEMRTSAERETSQGSDYIRVIAAKHFLKDMKSEAQILFGNGEPSERSSYGRRLVLISKKYGFYLNDIGILGSYYKYGLFYIILILGFFIWILYVKLPENIYFLKLFIIFQICSMFTAGVYIQGTSGTIILCISLYLIDINSNKNLVKAMN